jgi:ethanolamine utilization protein EutN
MLIARIDGSITSTVKHKSLRGFRLLIGQRLEADGSEVGDPLVLMDDLGARVGSHVLVTTDGDLARQKLADNTTPSRMIVVGIIDCMSGTAPNATAVPFGERAPAPGAGR